MMQNHGYAAHQFLIAFPDVLISGEHAPTIVHLESVGHDSEVIVCAHATPTPLSSMARNLITLSNFSKYGPASCEELPDWQKMDHVFPRSFEGKVTIFEVLVPKIGTDLKYDDRPNSKIDWDNLSHPLVRASRAINLYLVALRIVFDTGFALMPGGHLEGPILHRMCRVKESLENERRSVSVRPIKEFAVSLGGTKAPELELDVEFDETKIFELELALDDIKSGNRILSSKDRMIAAKTALHVLGDLSGAALESATAAEMFLDTVLTMLTWENIVISEGISHGKDIIPKPSDIETFDPKRLLTKRIKSDYSKLLGGQSWSIDNGIVGEWYKDCYLLRHRVIHGGYFPKYKESLRSINSTINLITFVLDSICSNKTKYPRTAWMLLGENGLRKRNSYSNKYQKIFEGIVDKEPVWRQSYMKYRDLLSTSILEDR